MTADHSPASPRRPRVLIGVVLLWCAVTACGFYALDRYAARAGAAACAGARWPQGTALRRGEGQYTLVVVLHPRCPCSRATLTELSDVLARCGDRLTTRAIFVRPPEALPGWENAELWRTASAMPGVTCAVDAGGAEAARFGAATSGQALLYDATGALRFAGGITASRGHVGANAGADAIVSLVSAGTGVATPPATRVYGCELLGAGPSAPPR